MRKVLCIGASLFSALALGQPLGSKFNAGAPKDVLVQRNTADSSGLPAAQLNAIINSLSGVRRLPGKPFVATAVFKSITESGASEVRRPIARDELGRISQQITAVTPAGTRTCTVVTDPASGEILIWCHGERQALRIARRTLPLPPMASGQPKPVEPVRPTTHDLGTRYIGGIATQGTLIAYPGVTVERWYSMDYELELEVSTLIAGGVISHYRLEGLRAAVPSRDQFVVPDGYRTDSVPGSLAGAPPTSRAP